MGVSAFHNPPDGVIRHILLYPRRIAVVGCSPDATRDSHRIARLLMQKGHTMVPVNPEVREILGQTCFASLSPQTRAPSILASRPVTMPDMRSSVDFTTFWSSMIRSRTKTEHSPSTRPK